MVFNIWFSKRVFNEQLVMEIFVKITMIGWNEIFSAQLEKIIVLRICDACLAWLLFVRIGWLCFCCVLKASVSCSRLRVIELNAMSSRWYLRYVFVRSSSLYCHHFTFSYDKPPQSLVDFRFIKQALATSLKSQISNAVTSINSYFSCVRFAK